MFSTDYKGILVDSILILIVILIGIALAAVILVQQSKGSDIGASFGSGASGTVFGAKGATSFFFKLTAGLAIAFVIAIVTLVKVTNSSNLGDSVITTAIEETTTANQQPAVPVLQSEDSSPTETSNQSNQTGQAADQPATDQGNTQ